MDDERNEERANNKSRDRFGHRLSCRRCGGDNVEIQQMLYRSGDRYVPGIYKKCVLWLEWDCRDCDF